MDLVALVNEQLRQIGPVLPSYTSDQRAFCEQKEALFEVSGRNDVSGRNSNGLDFRKWEVHFVTVVKELLHTLEKAFLEVLPQHEDVVRLHGPRVRFGYTCDERPQHKCAERVRRELGNRC